MINLIGGRKVIFGLIIIVVGVAVHFFAPKGLTNQMVELLTFIGVGFFLGNGVENTANAIRKRKPSAASAELIALMGDKVQAVGSALSAVEAQVAIVKEQNALLGQQNAATQEAVSKILDIAANGRKNA